MDLDIGIVFIDYIVLQFASHSNVCWNNLSFKQIINNILSIVSKCCRGNKDITRNYVLMETYDTNYSQVASTVVRL